MGDFADRLRAKIVDRIETELDSVGVDMVSDIQKAISTPVVRDENGFVIERSQEGDNPWLETGHLQASEKHEIVNISPVSVSLLVINDAPYAKAVHNGHGKEGAFGAAGPRPFHDLACVDWFPAIPDRIRDAITGAR